MTQALLVSHGQPSDPDVGEAEIAALAAQVETALGAPVKGVTLAAKGRLEALADAAPQAVIYPMFMTDGWFTRVQIPRRLQGRGVVRLAPFGTDPALAPATARALSAYCAQAGWTPDSVALAVLGHGSGRSPMAALDTAIFVDRLRRCITFSAIRIGFVEQAPSLESALAGLPERALALPFFAARRGHVLDDLPEAAKAVGFSGQMLDPLGLFDMVPAMIARRIADVQRQRT